MTRSVLHVLSQRPGRTGSGTTLDALVREARRTGWQQHVVIGIPEGEPPEVGELPADRLYPLFFGAPPLDFPVPGMSDVMPYTSTRFSTMDEVRIETYRDAWRRHLRGVVDSVRPDVIHAHHLWLVSALIKDVAPEIPVVTHGHGTGLRQARLCPHLAGIVREGCARNDRFAVLHDDHARGVVDLLGVEPSRVHVVGAGYRSEIFHAEGRGVATRPRLLFAGKLSHAKGLGPLLEAWEIVASRLPGAELHIAGGGSGAESDHFRDRISGMGPDVHHHGPLKPEALADLMRTCSAFVLPSFYEGLPLVLIEALACGCRLVATDLPGVRNAIAPHAGPLLDLVALPNLESIDKPVQAELPAFAARLAAAVERALSLPAIDPVAESTASFTWRSVFQRVESLWMRDRP